MNDSPDARVPNENQVDQTSKSSRFRKILRFCLHVGRWILVLVFFLSGCFLWSYLTHPDKSKREVPPADSTSVTRLLPYLSDADAELRGDAEQKIRILASNQPGRQELLQRVLPDLQPVEQPVEAYRVRQYRAVRSLNLIPHREDWATPLVATEVTSLFLTLSRLDSTDVGLTRSWNPVTALKIELCTTLDHLVRAGLVKSETLLQILCSANAAQLTRLLKQELFRQRYGRRACITTKEMAPYVSATLSFMNDRMTLVERLRGDESGFRQLLIDIRELREMLTELPQMATFSVADHQASLLQINVMMKNLQSAERVAGNFPRTSIPSIRIRRRSGKSMQRTKSLVAPFKGQVSKEREEWKKLVRSFEEVEIGRKEFGAAVLNATPGDTAI